MDYGQGKVHHVFSTLESMVYSTHPHHCPKLSLVVVILSETRSILLKRGHSKNNCTLSPTITTVHLSVVDSALFSQNERTQLQKLLEARQISGFLYLENHGVVFNFMFDPATGSFQMALEGESDQNGMSSSLDCNGTWYVNAKASSLRMT